ncbi:MAG: S8 family serine peptidase [Alphaproteobacteria bacterium]|nr:S8 family serine peptidase [Alphaproteobacteria bacterium]
MTDTTKFPGKFPTTAMRALCRWVGILTLSFAVLALPVHAPGDAGPISGPALADEDDDGDDGDGGDDSDDGDDGYDGDDSGGGGSRGSVSGAGTGGNKGVGSFLRRLGIGKRPSSARTRSRGQAAIPRPARAENEIVALGLSEAQIAALSDQGFQVLERQTVELIDLDAIRLQVPTGLSLEDAREAVRTLNPQAVVDFNHFYRTGGETADGVTHPCSEPACAAAEMINWPSQPGNACTVNARIGMIDTGINGEHTAFANSGLELIDIVGEDRQKSSRQHGTAVAAILLGSADSRSPGLIPGATVIAVDAFHRDRRKDERSDIYTLVRAMDVLAGRAVSVINFSLAGPPNDILEEMVNRLHAADIVLVAAAGNGGPRAEPAYPAAYRHVLAVTAIDRNKRSYRRAGRGEHIDLAAPGVDVWTAASIRGARTKTGTSFATPFVTAAVALAQHRLELTGHDDIAAALTENAMDLGEPGRDDIFGFGLVQAVGTCPDPTARGNP